MDLGEDRHHLVWHWPPVSPLCGLQARGEPCPLAREGSGGYGIQFPEGIHPYNSISGLRAPLSPTIPADWGHALSLPVAPPLYDKILG